MFLIDSQIQTIQGNGPYIVVDVAEYEGYETQYVVRIDIEGNDASMSEGLEGKDWEYMYIPASEAASVR